VIRVAIDGGTLIAKQVSDRWLQIDPIDLGPWQNRNTRSELRLSVIAGLSKSQPNSVFVIFPIDRLLTPAVTPIDILKVE
jgi:hypothetical protein